MILVRLSEADVQTLIDRTTANPHHKITINLEAQTVTDDQGFHATFEIDPFRKYCLLNGLDDIGLTLRHESELDAFESKHDKDFWSAPKTIAIVLFSSFGLVVILRRRRRTCFSLLLLPGNPVLIRAIRGRLYERN